MKIRTLLGALCLPLAAGAMQGAEPAAMGTEFQIGDYIYTVVTGNNVDVVYDAKGAGSCADDEGIQSDPVLTVPTSVTYEDYTYPVVRYDIQAFYNLTELREMTMPAGLQWIMSSAMEYCKRLESLNLPESVWRIDQNAFANCKALTGVVIPYSVTRLAGNAFSGCSSMSYIVMLGELGNTFSGAFTGLPEDCVLYLPNDAYDLATGWSGEKEKLGPYVEEEGLTATKTTLRFRLEDNNVLDAYVHSVQVNGQTLTADTEGYYSLTSETPVDTWTLKLTCDVEDHVYRDTVEIQASNTGMDEIEAEATQGDALYRLDGTKAGGGDRGLLIEPSTGRKILK